MTRVRIVTAGHEVEVETEKATDPDDLAGLALWLHRATRDPKLDRAFGITVGGETFEPPHPRPLGAWDDAPVPDRY